MKKHDRRHDNISRSARQLTIARYGFYGHVADGVFARQVKFRLEHRAEVAFADHFAERDILGSNQLALRSQDGQCLVVQRKGLL